MNKRAVLIILCLLLLAAPVYALKFVFPQPQGYVSDYADCLDANARLRLENLARELERRTGVELAVVIVKTTLPYDHLEYATRLFAHWHIGKEGQDNGVLLLLSMKERKVRIETGYGIEEIIPDGKAGELLDKYVVPKLRSEEYAQALYNGAFAIADTLGQFYHVNITGEYYPVQQAEDAPQEILQILFFCLLIVLLASSRFGWWPLIIMNNYGGYRPSGFGSYGGGFGGFGGGASGGGGASRSW